MEGTIQERQVGWSEVLEIDPLPEAALQSADCYIDRTLIESQAHELIAGRDRLAVEYKTKETYRNDARTALFEALTASGHLSTIELTGSLDEIHGMMLSVLLNSYSDTLPAPERRRQFQELCNELTRQEVERRIAIGTIPPETQVAEISDFIEGLSEKSAQLLGYRPSNKKGMVRSSCLIDNHNGTYTRISEQVSRSNAEAVKTISFLQEENIQLRPAVTADVSVLGTTILHDMSEGVIGLMRRLDEHQGVDICYGELRNATQIPYDRLREESQYREYQAQWYAKDLAVYTEKLDQKLQAGEINNKQHRELLQQEIKQTLRAICTMRPEYTKDCFGEAAAQTYQEASNRAAAGDTDGAAAYIESRQHLEETVSLCGMSISPNKAAKLGVQPSALEQLIKLGLENWPWTRGVCRVDQCPTRPSKTDVGPCSVCRGCQNHFDNGKNPATVYRRMKKAGKGTIAVGWGVFAASQKPKEEFRFFDFSKYKKEKQQKTAKHERMAA